MGSTSRSPAGVAGGQGPAHRFEVGDATVTVSAVPGGSVHLRIDH